MMNFRRQSCVFSLSQPLLFLKTYADVFTDFRYFKFGALFSIQKAGVFSTHIQQKNRQFQLIVIQKIAGVLHTLNGRIRHLLIFSPLEFTWFSISLWNDNSDKRQDVQMFPIKEWKEVNGKLTIFHFNCHICFHMVHSVPKCVHFVSKRQQNIDTKQEL